MLTRIPIAFAAGLLSVVFPCVLPLVPAYLSTLSAVEVGRLGEHGVGRRVALASLPFMLGFTLVFVALGVASTALATALGVTLQREIAGFILVVVGLAFLRVLPWPERAVVPGLLTGARRTGSSVLLGGAFAVCAAPCVGPVLAGILVLASSSSTIVRGGVLLAAYSAGLAFAFLLAGLAFGRAMGAFRWLRDHYVVLSGAGGAILVSFGLLLFFNRYWWLQAGLHHMLTSVGID